MNLLVVKYFFLFFVFSILINAQDFDDSIISTEASLEQLNDSSKIKVLSDLSWYYRTLNPEKSIKLAKKGLEISKSINDKKNTATFYNILGVTNSIIGNYTLALENHFKGLSIRENRKDTAGIAASLNNIGLVYEKIEDYDLALDYYKKSYALKKLLKNKLAISISLNNIGFALRKLGKLDESLKYYHEALKLNLELKDEAGLSLTYSNLSILYREKKFYQNALDYAFRSLKLREKLEDNTGVTLQYHIIGTIYSLMNKYHLALEYFFKSLMIAKKFNFRPNIQENYKAIAEVYEKEGHFKTALQYYKYHQNLRDSLLNEEKTKRIIELQERYNAKQNIIKIQKLEIEKETELRNYAIYLFIISLIFTIILFYRVRIAKKLLKSLQESERFNKELIKNIPSYLLIINNNNSKIIYSNKLMQDVFGYSESEFENLDIFDLVDERYREITKNNRQLRLKGHNIEPYEIVGVTRSGERRNLILRATIIPYKNITATLTLLNDITELKKFEKELVTAKEKAEYSDKLKSEFLAQISHEIRTPLNVILSWTDMLESDLKDKLNEELVNVFNIIREQGKRTIRTIELILNMSEMQLGSYEPIFRKTDIESEILLKLIADTKFDANKKRLTFNYKKKTENCVVLIDEYSISQSIKNILDNAVKFTKSGGIEVSLFRNDKNELCISIKDTGIGISEEYIPNLFKPFRQEYQGYSRVFEGNGLALALTKKYLELNNARIDVESTKNVGSVFTITFINS